MDRFIPNRSVMDMDYALSVMTNRPQQQQQRPSNPVYQALLSAALGKKPGSRILAFGDHKPQDSFDDSHLQLSTPSRQFPPKPDLNLDAPDLLCHDSFTALDWGRNNIIAVALSETLYGYNFDTKKNFIIAEPEEEDDEFITGVNWNPDGNRIAVGLSSGEVQVWDVLAQRKVAEYLGGFGMGHVGSLAWSESQNLTIARGDGKILDWNLDSHRIVASYPGHRGQILGLKWSRGRWLATCGMDREVNIWDRSRPSSQYLKFKDHVAAVRGLDWSPVRSDLLVSGSRDGEIKFWSTSSGKCLQSVNAGSEVLSLCWTSCPSELLSSHGRGHGGSSGNHVSMWRYPSMEIACKTEQYDSRLLYMAISPDGRNVASALGASAPEADDGHVMVWNLLDQPRVKKAREKKENKFDFFSSFSSIRLDHQSSIPEGFGSDTDLE